MYLNPVPNFNRNNNKCHAQIASPLSLSLSDLFRIMSKYFVIYFWLSVFALSEQTYDITELFIGVNMLGCNCSTQTIPKYTRWYVPFQFSNVCLWHPILFKQHLMSIWLAKKNTVAVGWWKAHNSIWTIDTFKRGCKSETTSMKGTTHIHTHILQMLEQIQYSHAYFFK